MSRIKLGAATSAALIVSVQMASASPFEFAGFYAGAHVGYSEASADFGPPSEILANNNPQIELQSLIFLGNNSGDLSGNGGMGGFQAGYNFISSNFMYGVEADFSLSGANPDGPCPNSPGDDCEVNSGPMATLRARAGYAVDDWLIYVTGGRRCLKI